MRSTAPPAEVEAARGDIALTFFEFATLAGLWLCLPRRPGCAPAGSGAGAARCHQRWWNRTSPRSPPSPLDHCDWPRDTREAVAVEKVGVYRGQTRHQRGAQSASDHRERSGAPRRLPASGGPRFSRGRARRRPGITTACTTGWGCPAGPAADERGSPCWRPWSPLGLLLAESAIREGWPRPPRGADAASAKRSRRHRRRGPQSPFGGLSPASCACSPARASAAPWWACSRTRIWRVRWPNSMASWKSGISRACTVPVPPGGPAGRRPG